MKKNRENQDKNGVLPPVFENDNEEHILNEEEST
jgi:hypothetical protein